MARYQRARILMLAVASATGLGAAPTDAPPAGSTIRGRVLAPDGHPVAGATVAPAVPDTAVPPVPTTRSDEDGRFTLVVPEKVRRAMAAARTEPTRLLAQAPGFGIGLVSVKPDSSVETIIRLVTDEQVIEGQILDEAGQPVAGASVTARAVYEPRPMNPDENHARSLLRSLEDETNRDRVVFGMDKLAVDLTAATGPDGRFTLRGIGPDRIALLQVWGPTIATAEILVVTRDPIEDLANHPAGRKLRRDWFYFRRFTSSVGMTRVVHGVARDFDTGKPLADALVQGMGESIRNVIQVEARTDATGEYQLFGLPGSSHRSVEYRISLRPAPGQPYPTAHVTQTAEGGQEPVEVDFDVRRAVILRGRITDQRTGLPVGGRVHTLPCSGAPPADGYPGFDAALGNTQATDDDGRYELVVPAGRSLLAFINFGPYRRRTGQGAEGLPEYDPDTRRLPPTKFHASILTTRFLRWAEVNTPTGADSATLDLQIEPDLPPGADGGPR